MKAFSTPQPCQLKFFEGQIKNCDNFKLNFKWNWYISLHFKVANTVMLASSMKLLFLAIALVCVAARPEFDFPANIEADELDDVKMDLSKAPAKSFLQLNRCPFDCTQVCIIKNGIDYECNKQVSDCCHNACQSYQYCSSHPWVCYIQLLDKICMCRRNPNPTTTAPLTIQESKSVYE